ncbi:MAG: S8 family serine peptidase [Candidatus Thorarchaeota archaeon]
MLGRNTIYRYSLGLILLLSFFHYAADGEKLGWNENRSVAEISSMEDFQNSFIPNLLPIQDETSLFSKQRQQPFLLTFSSPLTNEDFQELSRLGVVMERYIPPYSLLVSLDSSRKSEIDSLPFIKTIESPFLPQFEEFLTADGQILELKMQVYPSGIKSYIPIRETNQTTPVAVDANLISAIQAVRSLGGKILWAYGDQMAFRISSTLAMKLAAVPEILWIEKLQTPSISLNNVRSSFDLDALNQLYGYNGTGIIVASYDTGCYWSHIEFNDSGTTQPNFDGQIADYLYDDGPPFEDGHGHGTAVAGIVGGIGINGNARGVAPGVKLLIQEHGLLPATDAPYFGIYRAVEDAKAGGAYLQSNSWGTEASGQYLLDSAVIDQAISELGVSLLYAAGNTGPSGNTLTIEAASKNAIAVGSIDDHNTPGFQDDSLVASSSRGPAEDGRIKPDIVAPGNSIYTISRTGSYTVVSGTSAATPVAAGLASILTQAYREDHWHTNPFGQLPSPALLKTLLVASAQPIEGKSYGSEIGWGLPNPRNLIENSHVFTLDESIELETSQSWILKVRFNPGSAPRLSLAWTDPPAMPGVSSTLVNDLDLLVISPNGTFYRGNQFSGTTWLPNPAARDSSNNIENVFLAAPSEGDWTVIVTASSIWLDAVKDTPEFAGQDFALTITDLLSPIPTVQTSRSIAPLYPSDIIGGERLVYVTIADVSANDDPVQQETIAVYVNSTSDPVGIHPSLLESDEDSGIFQGELALGAETLAELSQIQAKTGDTVKLMYQSLDEPVQVMSRTLKFDSEPPAIYNSRFLAIGRQQAILECKTNEMTEAWLEISADGQNWVKFQEYQTFSRHHELVAGNLQPETQYFLRIGVSDVFGNQGEYPKDLPSIFATQSAPELAILYVNDTLESHPRLSLLLDRLNIAHDTFSSINTEAPDLVNLTSPIWGVLDHYDIVIWDCGWTWTLTLTAEEREVIEEFQTAGGSILFVGADIGYDAHADDSGTDPRDDMFPEWFEENLAASYIADDVFSIEEISSTRFGDTMKFVNGTGDSISGAIGGTEVVPDSIGLMAIYSLYVDAISSASNSLDGNSTSFVWGNGNAYGAVVKDESDLRRLVYQTMPYDSIRGVEHQIELLRRELNWLANGFSHDGILLNQTTEILGEISDGFRPIPYATAYLFDSSEGTNGPLLGVAISDELGAVRFMNLQEGSYIIQVEYEDDWEFRNYTTEIPIAVEKGQSVIEDPWILEGRGIIGIVKSGIDGRGVANASVSAIIDNSIIATVNTDDDGNFELRGIPSENYSLLAIAEDYIPTRWTNIELLPDADFSEVTLELEEASSDVLLVVENSKGLDLELSLGLSSFPAAIWPVYSLGSPTASDMNQFDAVIWYAGITGTMDSETTFSANKAEELQKYLEANGSLLLIGQDVIYDLGADHTFIQNYLGVQSSKQDVGISDTLVGVSEDVIGDGIELECHQGEFLDYADVIKPKNEGLGILKGHLEDYYYGIRNVNSRVIFLSFDTSFLLSIEEITELINRSLQWFGIEKQGYEKEYGSETESAKTKKFSVSLFAAIFLALPAVIRFKTRKKKIYANGSG